MHSIKSRIWETMKGSNANTTDMYQELASATLKIECGDSPGSGFHFRNENYVVTNAHVVKEAINDGSSIVGITEDGESCELELVDYSPESQYDFAILEVIDPFSQHRTVLEPTEASFERGRKILFSGFPHGIDDLLVHQAHISGPEVEHSFYIDGSVNGGNSGGPIVDLDTGNVIGIVTQRRYLTPVDIDHLTQQMDSLSSRLSGGGADMIMGGVSISDALNLIGRAIVAVRRVLDANANSGIGIGFEIQHVNERMSELIEN